jgi:hypothetical protein
LFISALFPIAETKDFSALKDITKISAIDDLPD